MADHPTRRDFGKVAAGAVLAAAVPHRAARAAASDKKTLRFIAQSDLRVLDPIWTTAYITRNHGYMVFDTLFAIDAEFAPHPQMVGEHAVSADKLTYNFKLRDGLALHDAVRCAVSIAPPRSSAGWRVTGTARRWQPCSTRSSRTARWCPTCRPACGSSRPPITKA